MIKFDGNIVQFGFGAVGKSFYEKVSNEIDFDENKYFVITMDKNEFAAYAYLGGMGANFVLAEIKQDNFKEVFERYLGEGDLLIDFADTVGTREICDWCASKNIMYLNTGEADWPENWYSIFNENTLKHELKKKHSLDPNTNKYPIVLQHGNNPGLVSHFVKAGIDYIIDKQISKDANIKKLIKENKYNELARLLGIRMIHVNDIDLQKVSDAYRDDKLYSTWCIDSFFFEMLSEATMNVGSHEKIDYNDKCNMIDYDKGFLEFKDIAVNKKCKTYYPGGSFEGFLVPHEETITIAKSLEVKENGANVYRPSVMFLYSPCEYAKKYFVGAKVNEYPNVDPNKPQDYESANANETTIVRGYKYPKNCEIVYKEKIKNGTEYVGVLIVGDNFDPVWVGNRIEPEFLYRDEKASYWQTPTITPVAMSALAATCWMIKNKDKGGIYFPDEIREYKEILKIAEKYISKTIYKTFDKKEIEKSLNVDLSNIQAKDFFVE